MLFLETWFWVFAAAAIPIYWVCPAPLKVYWLLVASAVFQYHFAGPAGMAPIVVLAVLTYVAALLPRSARGPSFTTVAVLVLVGALAFYKYSDFILKSAAGVVARVSVAVPGWVTGWKSPAIPLGISFFTFEFLHYLYEVRVRGRDPIVNPIHFSVFAFFFPTLAAGPIKRFPEFVPQLAALENPSPAVVWTGAARVIRGLFKKICIADLVVEYVKAFEHGPMNGPLVVGLAVAQGFRIYYDFAGYSDIAIGLAQMVNLRVPENFAAPYWSTSLQEFWRRWHMSLSSWIRDYVYIPLGGNRAHRVANLLAAMVLCGLWHGAAWHFAAWGMWHGAGLAAESVVRRARPSWFDDDRIPSRLFGWATTYAYVTFGWLLFFYPVHTVVDMTKALARWPGL